MTLEEYEQIIGNALVTACNNRDMIALTATFKEADQALEKSQIGPAAHKEFWERVREIVDSGMFIKRQANSALITLMQAIEREIALRIGKNK